MCPPPPSLIILLHVFASYVPLLGVERPVAYRHHNVQSFSIHAQTYAGVVDHPC